MSSQKDEKKKKIGSKMEFDMEFSLSSGALIGQGSFGSVYRCRSAEDGMEWAIKIVEVPDRDEYKGMAEREMLMSMQMDTHPNIIAVKRVYSWSNEVTHKFVCVIVQELADKGLFEIFQNRQKANITFSDEEILEYLKQSVDALLFLMIRHGIYHRDIKTENILLKQNRIKITDFGVSKTIQAEKLRSLQNNTITGTPLFLSPKLWDAYIKRNQYSAVHDLQKSDIFSLGLVFLQLALLLTNQEIAGLNQPDSQTKLISLLNKIRSSKLRTIFASMVAFEEEKRADYYTIQRFIAMNDNEFTPNTFLQYVLLSPQNIVQSPLFFDQILFRNDKILYQFPNLNQIIKRLQNKDFKRVQGIQSNVNNTGQIQAKQEIQVRGKLICFRHNKELEYFCEEETCLESLCSDCRGVHTQSHLYKINGFRQVVGKYVEQNILCKSYSQIQNTSISDLKTKTQAYSNKLQEEMQKIGNDLRKQVINTIDSNIKKWTQDIQSRLDKASRETESIQTQVRQDEKSLKENQQRFNENNPSSLVYLQIIAKSQNSFQTSLSIAQERLQRIINDIQEISKIDNLYLSFLGKVYTLQRTIILQFDQFFSELLLPNSEILPSPIIPAANQKSTKQPLFPQQAQKSNLQALLSPKSQQNQLFIPQTNKTQQLQPIQQNNSPLLDMPNVESPSPIQTNENFINFTFSETNKVLEVRTKINTLADIEIYPTKEFKGKGGDLLQLIFIQESKSRELLVSMQSDGRVLKICLENEQRSEVELKEVFPRCSLYLQNKKRILCGCVDGQLFLFDPINMLMVDKPFKERHDSSVNCLIYLSKKPQVLSGSQKGQIILWNIDRKLQVRVYSGIHEGEVNGIVTIIKDTLMISVGQDKKIIITELATNKTIFLKQNAHSTPLTAIKLYKGSSFFTAAQDGTIKLWNWAHNDLKEIGFAKIHSSSITLLDYMPKSNILITSAIDSTLIFTDIMTYLPVAHAKQESLNGPAKTAYWSPPFLYTSDSTSIRKWDNKSFAIHIDQIRKNIKSRDSKCAIF